MVASLRRSARKWTHITPATLSYGFASLRELRSYFDSSLRWHQVLKKYTEGEPIPIESGAIAIARVAHPYLDEEQVVQKIDTLFWMIKSTLDRKGLSCKKLLVDLRMDNGNKEKEEQTKVNRIKEILTTVNEVLFKQLGFSGNDKINYPENSLIDEVLIRKTGIPISLSVLYMSLAQRLDIKLDGFCFPGHFLVGHLSDFDEKYSLFVDVYNKGSFHTASDFQERLLRNGISPSSYIKYASPCTLPEIYYRMIENILEVYRREENEHNQQIWQKERDALEPYLLAEE